MSSEHCIQNNTSIIVSFTKPFKLFVSRNFFGDFSNECLHCTNGIGIIVCIVVFMILIFRSFVLWGHYVYVSVLISRKIDVVVWKLFL